MKQFLILLSFFLVGSLCAQEITSFQDEFSSKESNEITIAMDSTNVLIKYWDGDYIYVNTDLAYKENLRSVIFEVAPVHVFGLENIKEEEGKLLVREKEIVDADQRYGPIGQFHTLYLPHSVTAIEWVVNIPSSL